MRAKPIPYNNNGLRLNNPARSIGTTAGLGRRAGAWFLHELREILPPTIFFFIGFNLIVLTTNLILAEYAVAFGNFMIATAAALVVGKAVLGANVLPFLRRYDRAQPILLQLKRQRIRELVRLNRLADAHSEDEFRDPASAAHHELVGIVRRLAR